MLIIQCVLKSVAVSKWLLENGKNILTIYFLLMFIHERALGKRQAISYFYDGL